jgi:hypothetical protein
VYHHPSVSLNKEKICREISENKIAVCEQTQDLRTERELSGFELSVFDSVSSRNNILVPRHALRKSFSSHFSRSQQTAYNF